MTAAFDAILETALAWHEAGTGAALATVVETWGSAPRPVGAQLAVSGAGEMAGSVSGGCVEGAVVAEAADVLATGQAKLLEYGVSDDDAFAVGLACGGTIRVLLEPVGAALTAAMLRDILAARAGRRPVAYVADTAGPSRRLGDASEFPERFRADRSGFEADGRTFVQIHNPPLRLAVVGAVHIAQPLVAMARLAGYDVTLIDPRDAFASETRFPGERLVHDWPDEALGNLGLDGRTAVVTLTHDPKLDDPALRAALASEVFYIGALGSTRTHGKRVARLGEAGVGEAEIARIHAPVGLDIGARSPAEIAISILAEITATLRRG
ncbi:MAG: XdhC family protein [Paracoccaceae bacterium]|nr:XdhC family protein [Paracoccaceae bacterium]